jgi:hypothetical protein
VNSDCGKKEWFANSGEEGELFEGEQKKRRQHEQERPVLAVHQSGRVLLAVEGGAWSWPAEPWRLVRGRRC